MTSEGVQYHEFDAPITPLVMSGRESIVTCREPLKFDALLRFHVDDDESVRPKPFISIERASVTSSPQRLTPKQERDSKTHSVPSNSRQSADADPQTLPSREPQEASMAPQLPRESSLANCGPAILIEKPSFATPQVQHARPAIPNGAHHHQGELLIQPVQQQLSGDRGEDPIFPVALSPTMPPEFLRDVSLKTEKTSQQHTTATRRLSKPEEFYGDSSDEDDTVAEPQEDTPQPKFGEVKNPLNARESSHLSARTSEDGPFRTPDEQVALGKGRGGDSSGNLEWTLPVPPPIDFTSNVNEVKHSAEHSQNLAAASTVVSVHGDAVILHSRLLQFLRRLCQSNDPTQTGGLLEIHRLKRLCHAAKLTPEQRGKLLPSSAQGKKLIPLEICGKYFLRHANKDITDADAIVVALEGLSDGVVNSQESVFSLIEERVARIVSDNRARFADNTFRFVWDSVHLVSIFAFLAISLDTNVLKLERDMSTPDSWVLAVILCIHAFWLLDVLYSIHVVAIDHNGRLVRDHTSIMRQRKAQLIIDAFCLFPLDFILEGADAPFAAFLTFRVMKFVKMFRVSYLYELVNRDIITPGLVIFHFQVKKAVIGLAWLFLAVLMLATIHNLIDIYSIEPAYGERKYPTLTHSVVAVSIILSGSNADFEVWVTGDKVLYVALAICAMIGIGLVVGQLTSLVFSNSVSAENYQLMRDTLDIVEHYNVPKAIQREVLSFQMHALNDDVVRHMSNLQQLPLQMQKEILMYIKIDAVGRVKLFSGASQECHTALAACLSRKIVEPESEVIRFGEVGKEMYMLAHGYADVILGNGKVVTTFTRGDCFGEMALVQKDAKRTATVRALTYCDLWTLSKDAFLEALVLYPELLSVVEVELVARKGNIAELRSSIDAVQQEMMKLDKEEELLSSPGSGGQLKPSVVPFDVAVGASRRKKSSAAPSLFVATHRATIHLGSDEALDVDQSKEAHENLEQRDVHGGHGPSSRWTATRLSTFRQMSLPQPARSSPRHHRLSHSSTAPRSPISVDDELQEALRAIESVKTFVDVQTIHAGSSFRARHSSSAFS
ncbi:cation efflux transmembrane transport protein, putative [Bodo saltans]|uniref:Cation efflux transmembrane transport protein, putative n=1 Tax=Bodo saltans TaxID=75058 RepID=A0A0S4JEH4_BODSA|nr:cation efflux transmembrane transport protein, putative [Bodo saltans]|eukprot:CUG88693.1 cation efflux transmembrane transport protein, putative [Bodo saltans]